MLVREEASASVLWIGVSFLVFGTLWTAFKGYVVWDVAHHEPGGVPSLDFVIFCPIPISAGLGFLFPHHLSCGFQFGIYTALAVVYGIVHWIFNRVGARERSRQLAEIQRNAKSPPVVS
jgi:hypothetical protein